MDAKICPDGTVLGRLPVLNCSFPGCPSSGGGGGTNAACSSAAKNYAYTDTAYSPSNLCVSGSSPTVGNGAVPFPAPGKTVTWSCFNSSSPTVTCTASRAVAPITCDTADGKTYPTSGPPSADRCVNTTQTNFAFRHSGSYWNGWTWNCGTASCSANLSPGICGNANKKTDLSSAPSTPTDLCLAGVASSVSGGVNGPWTWSCTGTACSASKTASCTPSCSLNPASYCTTYYLGGDGCGGSCGYGTIVCPTPRLKVCPATATLNPGDTLPLEARYWANLSSIPTCSTVSPVPTVVTNSASWLSYNTSIATVSNSGTKGVVTAGSPASTSLASIRAQYSSLPPSFSEVTVNVSGGPSPAFSCQSNTSITLTNAVSCSGDMSGLTSDVQNTLVDSCSSPLGSEPKCEYTCKSGYTRSGTTCIPIASCVCDSGENATQCRGTYKNSCGRLCEGSKQCDGHFIEVAP